MKDNVIYAYDFFDTIVHRRCNPEVIVFWWAKRVSRLCKYSISAKDIYRERKVNEKKLKSKMEEVSYDILIQNIYHSIDIRMYISEKDFIRTSFEYEIEEEMKHIYADEETIQEIKYRFDAGNDVIIISDFYGGEDYIERILDFLGIRYMFYKIFVSSNLNKRKSTGNLYKYVLDCLSVQPSGIVMTGDNELSDVEIPKSLGIKSIYRPYKVNPQCDYKMLKKYLKKFINTDICSSPLNSYAEECVYFVSCLYKHIIKNNISLVLFCSREGQPLKAMFDYYAFNVMGDKNIGSEYFYISRRAAILPSLDCLDKEEFQFISRQYEKLEICDFLKCLSFSNDEISMVCDNIDLSANDCIFFTQFDNNLCKIKNSRVFNQLYETKRNDQKMLLLDYLSELGVNSNTRKMALVDVGWKGTIQDALQKMLGDRISIFGFYIGIKMSEYKCSNIENKYGLLFSDYPNKSKWYDLMNRNNLFWERILSADHGPTVGYSRDQYDRITPIINKDEKNTILYNYIAKFQSNMIKTYKKIIDLYSYTMWEPYENYNLMVENVLWRECVIYPQISFVEKKSWELFEENFGAASKEKNNFKIIIKKFREYAPYGFNRQIFAVTSKLNIKILNKIAIAYFKMIFLLKLLGIKIRGIYNKHT